MSQKIFIIIIGVLALLIISLFGAAFFIARDTGVPTAEVLRDILPFGGGGAETPVGGVRGPFSGEPSAVDTLVRTPGGYVLEQIIPQPIVGATAYVLPDGKTSGLLFVERATGNVFFYDIGTRVARRITNTTIPGVHEVIWGKDRVILRYLDENDVIKSWSGALTVTMIEKGSAERLEGVFLPDDIAAMTVSPNKDQIFYITADGTIAVGTTANLVGEKKRDILDHALIEWIPQWMTDRSLLLTTKASGGISGFSFYLSTIGVFEKIVGPFHGLIALASPENVSIVYATSEKNAPPKLSLFNQKSGASSALSFATFPEKCVWSVREEGILFCAVPDAFPAVRYPDSWYQGVVSFSDTIWKIDTEKGKADELSFPEDDIGKSIDATNLFLNSDENYLFFTNKKDSTLWSLKLR